MARSSICEACGLLVKLTQNHRQNKEVFIGNYYVYKKNYDGQYENIHKIYHKYEKFSEVFGGSHGRLARPLSTPCSWFQILPSEKKPLSPKPTKLDKNWYWTLLKNSENSALKVTGSWKAVCVPKVTWTHVVDRESRDNFSHYKSKGHF